MNRNELLKLCTSINSGKPAWWHRSLSVSFARSKSGLSSAAVDFTWRERLYVRFGIGRARLNADYKRRIVNNRSEEQKERTNE
jgi:hypothetical protein